MKYSVVKGDLFKVNDTIKVGEESYCLAHCISADLGMFAGVVTGFNQKYNMKNELTEHYGAEKTTRVFKKLGGYSIAKYIENEDMYVFNLITKKTVRDTGNYFKLAQALRRMKSQMEARKLHRLAMPKIGCGIDGLEWVVVESLVKQVFKDTDIEILVVEYQE